MKVKTLHRFAFASEQARSPASEGTSKWLEAHLYEPDPELIKVIEVAVMLQQPLLITGRPGIGKTSAAYWTAWRMGIDPKSLFHIQVHSDETAGRLRYEFDAVRYFRESQASALRGEDWDDSVAGKRRFVVPGALWHAFERSKVQGVVLLLDEIDKAPRDFPNDLLHELDQLEFTVPELMDPVTGAPFKVGAAQRHASSDPLPFICFITSNGERDLPDAFLRRCIHYHLQMTKEQIGRIALNRLRFDGLSIDDRLFHFALERFIELQASSQVRHRPELAEFLVWIKVLALEGSVTAERLRSVSVAQLPYIGVLLKEASGTWRTAPGEYD